MPFYKHRNKHRHDPNSEQFETTHQKRDRVNRKIVKIEKQVIDGTTIEMFRYTLSCGHEHIGDRRKPSNGLQPVKTYCEECSNERAAEPDQPGERITARLDSRGTRKESLSAGKSKFEFRPTSDANSMSGDPKAWTYWDPAEPGSDTTTYTFVLPQVSIGLRGLWRRLEGMVKQELHEQHGIPYSTMTEDWMKAHVFYGVKSKVGVNVLTYHNSPIMSFIEPELKTEDGQTSAVLKARAMLPNGEYK